MSHTAKVKPGKYDKPIVVVCESCGRETAHDVLTGIHSSDSSPDGDIQGWDDYEVIQCGGCKRVSFCHESRNTEDVDPETGGLANTIELFPARIAGRPRMRDWYYLPPEVRVAYQETRTAIIQSLPILAGIGIRAIVESVCKHKGANGRNLKVRIAQLVDMRLITPVEGDILQSLRFMGNAAAHETKAHSTEELNAGFDIVEHLLRTVYLLERQLRRLPKTR